MNRINPPAAASAEFLADHPAILGAWCRINIWQHCRDTLDLWDRFKYENGITADQQFAVIIPYCPEGPTSGTVGMYLGAALRKFFEERRRSAELVVWGIELCPPVNEDQTGRLDAHAARNVFRGFVAREELIRRDGLPLTNIPQDSGHVKPFDINIAFDGGRSKAPFDDIDNILPALDRAAAQTTACLINGAAGGDVAEGTNWLKEGGRWHAYLAHVICERSYSPACRYFNYYARLPWSRDPQGWTADDTDSRKDRFKRSIDQDIRPLLATEKDATVRERVRSLVQISDSAQAVKNGWWILSWVTNDRNRNRQRVEGYLEDAVERSRVWYEEYGREAARTVVARQDPFCINIQLPEGLRRSLAEQSQGQSQPIGIGASLGNDNVIVRDQVEGLITRVLERSDCWGPESDSQALFEQIIAINISGDPRLPHNRVFEPARENLQDFISIENRGQDGALNFLNHSIRDRSQNGFAAREGLAWKPRDIAFDVPAEFSYLVLARCRPEDGFRGHKHLRQTAGGL